MPSSHERTTSPEDGPHYLFVTDAGNNEQGPFELRVNDDGAFDASQLPDNIRTLLSHLAFDAFGRGSIPPLDGHAFIQAIRRAAGRHPYIHVRSSPERM